MSVVYFVILGFGKYMIDYEPYDFMSMSNVRQIAGAAILIYIGILDGYVVFVLIAGKCFVDKNVNMDKIKKEIIKQKLKGEKNNKQKKEDKNNEINIDKDTKKDEKNNFNTNNENNIGNKMNNNGEINKINIPKLTRKKLKPIQFNKKINNNIESNEDKKD